MILIGLTGGIGSGKSTVSEYLTKRGYKVLDADKVSREIVEPGSETLLKIKEAFGEEILNSDGSLNRRKLGGIVFSDPVKKAILENIMHKKIIEILLDRAKMLSDEKIVFIDAPLLFEAKLDKYVDSVWVVDADNETRIKRIMERDNLPKEEIQKRIDMQFSGIKKIRKANYVLDNSSEKENLYRQIDRILNNYPEK